MPIGAIAGSAVIGAGASIYSGNKAAKAQKNAAAQQAANERYFYDTTRADQAPYREAGTGALRKLSQMYGIEMAPETDWGAYVRGNPDILAGYQAEANARQGKFADIDEFGQFHYQKYGKGENRDLTPYQSGGVPGGVADYGGFMASPGYQFRLDEGIKAAERSAAARGLLGSGATLKAVQRYGEGLASQEYENYANALRSMAGIGQTSTQATSAAGAQAAGGISQAIGNAGNARASSYANTGAAINQGVSNIMGAYLGGAFGGGGGGATFSPYLPAAAQAQLNANVQMPSWYGG